MANSPTITEEFRTAAENLRKAIADVCLGSLEHVVTKAALTALADGWNEECDKADAIDSDAAAEWAHAQLEAADRRDLEKCVAEAAGLTPEESAEMLKGLDETGVGVHYYDTELRERLRAEADPRP